MKTYLQNLRHSLQAHKSFRCYCLQLIGAAVFSIMCFFNTHSAQGESTLPGKETPMEIRNKQ